VATVVFIIVETAFRFHTKAFIVVRELIVKAAEHVVKLVKG
jgi:hypothetical protein